MSPTGKVLSCSFCGKSQFEVVKLIAGPSIFICNECVSLCSNILDEPQVSDGKALTICKLCGNPGEVSEMINIPAKGYLCQECMPEVYEEGRKWYLKD